MKFNVAVAILAFAAIVRADYGQPTTTPYCDELTTGTPTGTVEGGVSTPGGGYATTPTGTVEGGESTPAGGYETSTPGVEGEVSTPCDTTPTGTVEGGESTPAGGYETSTPGTVEGGESTPCDGTAPTTPGDVEGEGPTPTDGYTTGTPGGEDDDCDEWETETPTPEATDINSYSAGLSAGASSGGASAGFIVGIAGAALVAVGAVAGTVFYVNKARKAKASMA
ncbi:hypothetical protein BJ742DRAFT_833984 [Cladochytrium replicatum]|nr:hypothetical protein BJ742DRAFT_833984 [Cladochytrium replicatum]